MPPARPKERRSATSFVSPLRTRVWTAGRILILIVALGVTYGAFFLTAMRVATRLREVKVPDVRGKTSSEADRLLANAGLVSKVDLRRPDPTLPADHVLSQDPEPGTVLRRQRAVRLRVSEGPREPVVPAVTGQPERTAEISLAQEGVDVAGRAEIRTSAFPPGTVVAQDPPGKSRAAKVVLLVNRGEGDASYVMPDVIGLMSVRVVDILRRRGFRVTVAAEVSYPGLPPGVVVQQTPQAGFQVGDGAPVQLEVTR